MIYGAVNQSVSQSSVKTGEATLAQTKPDTLVGKIVKIKCISETRILVATSEHLVSFLKGTGHTQVSSAGVEKKYSENQQAYF